MDLRTIGEDHIKKSPPVPASRRERKVMAPYRSEELVLGNLLEERASTHGSTTFLKLRDGELTFRDVDDTASRLAAGLAAHGIGKGDHVAILLPNGADILHVIFALAKLGAVAVPINTEYKGRLLKHVLETSNACALVVDEPFLDRVAAVTDASPALSLVVVRSRSKAPGAMRALSRLAIPLAGLLEHGSRVSDGSVRHSDLQAIMYTSGTTGPSKGVMVPHALALIDAQDSVRFMAFEPGETIYCPLPLFHAAALWDGAMAALLTGSSIAVVERFSASRFWDDVRHFEANVALGVFSMIPILLNQPPSPDDKDHPLRCFYMGKSALDEALWERFGVRSVETYTSTEVGIGTGSPYGEWRAGSCGLENSETHEVRVVDEQDREVAPGECGELVVRPRRPFALTPGYYNYPEVTVRAMRNLWFHTGDRAYRDEDGYLYFVSRIKDSIRRRGENISAFEVEQAVNRHEAVLESAAFGVPSELEEEEVMVVVVPQDGAHVDPEELAAHCNLELPSFMVPRYFEVLSELPKTPTGKLGKHELKKRSESGITADTWDMEKREPEESPDSVASPRHAPGVGARPLEVQRPPGQGESGTARGHRSPGGR